MLDDARMTVQDDGEGGDGVGARSRRRFLTQAIGGAGVLALSATGAVALRRADAKDDDDGGSGGGDGDDSGGGSGGGDNSGSGSGDDDDGHGDDDDGHGGDDDEHGDDDDSSGHGGGDDEDHDDDIRRAGTPVAGAIEILIDDDDADGFSPGTVTVDLGASVTFVNLDDDPHTATGGSFDTGVIEPGAAATVTLDKPGTLFYACLIHPVMTGTIVVRDADGSVPAATPSATPRLIAAADPTGGETVTIRDFAFDPASLTVPAGTAVTWENADGAPHTATGTDAGFDTGRLDAGASGAATFERAGTFAYRCEFHPDMEGTIVVE